MNNFKRVESQSKKPKYKILYVRNQKRIRVRNRVAWGGQGVPPGPPMHLFGVHPLIKYQDYC